jgi:soluble lytic murein transglycosylase-like protein
MVFGSLLFWGLTQFSFFSTAAPPSHGQLAPFFAPQVQRWEPQILAWAAEHDLDPNLVATVMQIESCGNPRATSRAGAMGLFQVMPYHFASGENAYEPATNAARGLDYLRRSLNAFSGNAAMALAGYNGGINGASRPSSLWAQETIDYQYWGENIYADAAAGRSESPVLAEWLGAGGASLCAQADEALALNPDS